MRNRYKYWVSLGPKPKVWDHKKGVICECSDRKTAFMIEEALYLLEDKKRGRVAKTEKA